MPTQKEFWDRKIKEWSALAYDNTVNLNILERIASVFRATNVRKEVTLKLIGPKTKNKTVLDLGSGQGEFSTSLLMRYEPKKLIGIDISEVAVKESKKLAKGLKLAEKTEFYNDDLTTMTSLPDFDLAIGVGLIDYFDKEQLRHLFSLIKTRPFIFSFFEKKFSILNILHGVYLNLQKGPKVYKYTKREIRNLAEKNSKLYFIKKNGFQFITNSTRIK